MGLGEFNWEFGSRPKLRARKAGGRLKAWPHMGAACLADTYAQI
jgi:hypothetical protein